MPRPVQVDLVGRSDGRGLDNVVVQRRDDSYRQDDGGRFRQLSGLSERKDTVCEDEKETYLTRPISWTSPDGSRSYSEKLTAVR